MPLLASSSSVSVRRSLSPHQLPSSSPPPSLPTLPPPSLPLTDFVDRRRTWQLRSSSSTTRSRDHPDTCCSSSAGGGGGGASNPFSTSSSAAAAVKLQSMLLIDKRKAKKLSPIARRRHSTGPPTTPLAVGCGGVGRCAQKPSASSCRYSEMGSDALKRRPSRVVEETAWLGLPPSPTASQLHPPSTPPPAAPSPSSHGTTERRMRTHRLRKMFSESTSSTSTEDHSASPQSRSAVSESEERNDEDEEEERKGMKEEIDPTLDLCSPDVASSFADLESSAVQQHQREEALVQSATAFSFDDQIKGTSSAQSNAGFSVELQRIARATRQNAVEDSAFEHETRLRSTSSEHQPIQTTAEDEKALISSICSNSLENETEILIVCDDNNDVCSLDLINESLPIVPQTTSLLSSRSYIVSSNPRFPFPHSKPRPLVVDGGKSPRLINSEKFLIAMQTSRDDDTSAAPELVIPLTTTTARRNASSNV